MRIYIKFYIIHDPDLVANFFTHFRTKISVCCTCQLLTVVYFNIQQYRVFLQSYLNKLTFEQQTKQNRTIYTKLCK